MLAQHFFQVHFVLTSKDMSAFFDRWSNQRSENKACDLSKRLAGLLQFTNMLLLEEKCGVCEKVGYSSSKLNIQSLVVLHLYKFSSHFYTHVLFIMLSLSNVQNIPSTHEDF